MNLTDFFIGMIVGGALWDMKIKYWKPIKGIKVEVVKHGEQKNE